MKRFLLPFGAITALLAGFYFLSDHNDGVSGLDYEDEIEQQRRELDYFMRNEQGSPFAAILESYQGLEFFKVDPIYKVDAKFTFATSMSAISIATSDGKERRFLPYGHLDFELNGKSNKLAVYQSSEFGKKELFLGFGDQTSAEGTYGGGRYLNIVHDGSDVVTLDFNLAYNPYCAYNSTFVCPIPPRENMLDISINAGEKDYKH